MSVSSSGAIETTGNVAGTASYASNAELLDGLDSTVFTLTSSFAAFTASQNILNGTYATTGSNTFRGSQYISSSFAPTNFTDTASLYTDGGLRVTRNAYLSSSLYVNGDLIIFGSQSVNYISSSQLDIADNIITVNTSTPTLRFGGLAVRDSGSLGTGLTGSLLWDSQDNQWIYSNPSGSEFDSAVFLVGPRNYGTIGNEVGITTNALVKGDSFHHMTSSGIFESGSNMGIGTASPAFKLDVQGTGRFTDALIVNKLAINSGNLNLASFPSLDLIVSGGIGFSSGGSGAAALVNRDGSGNTTFYGGTGDIKFTDVTLTSNYLTIKSAGNVGIGTASPTGTYGKLTVAGGIQITNDNNAKLEIGRYSSGAPNSYIKIGSGSDSLRITNAADSADLFTIANGGNVGIGITNPATSYGFSRSLVISHPTNSEISLEATTSGKVLSMGVTNGLNYFQTTAGNGYDFQIGGTSRFVISSTGAINTSSTLSVGGNASMARFYANCAFSSYTNDGLFNANSLYCSVSTPGSSDRIRLGYNDYGGGQYYGRIGFAAPTNWSLGIIGSVGNDFSIGVGFQGSQLYIYANGNYAFSGSNVSDRRKKANINYITTNQLDTILKLRPVTFNKIADEVVSENIHTGFIAQDIMEEGIPNLVMGSDEGGYGLDYEGVLALTVKAIQELKAENDTLKEILQRNNIQ
jgi:hypothetical protein